ncbi:MAG: sulfatase-like hydrolase/transferase [Chloroflexi bacterium]|nr:sulfatase-like hydrolase/transferase [Chloroflexota bacterium]
MGAGKPRDRAPNVVLFISDQQRADTMPGVRAAPGIQTPHLEWLARQGTLFRNAYCVTPMCSPARASLLSGLYPHTTGMVSNHQERPISNELHLSPDVKLLADYLQPLGYACAYTGKWHLGTGGDRRGFADLVTRSGDYDTDGPEQNEILRFCDRVGVDIGGKALGYDVDPAGYDPHTRVGASLLPLAWHPSTLDAVRAAQFVRQMAHDLRPFLLVYSCHEPHPPFVSPRPFAQMYAHLRDQMPLPETRRDDHGPRLLRHRPDWQLKPVAEYDDDELRAMWAAYYGAVSYVDYLVGTILAALIETDQFNDTLFIYTSDHGEMLGSHGLLLKGAVLYEELVNIPLLIRPPRGLDAPHETRRLVSHVDLAPTILEWCGADVPHALQGTSIRALAEGGDEPAHDGIALEYHSSNWGERPAPLRSWCTEDWKYVETVGGDDELYNLRADPLERHNLIDEPAAAEARAAMQSALHAWLRQSGDRWPEVPVPEREVPKDPGGPWASYR